MNEDNENNVLNKQCFDKLNQLKRKVKFTEDNDQNNCENKSKFNAKYPNFEELMKGEGFENLSSGDEKDIHKMKENKPEYYRMDKDPYFEH
jgi:hypothetical protein